MPIRDRWYYNVQVFEKPSMSVESEDSGIPDDPEGQYRVGKETYTTTVQSRNVWCRAISKDHAKQIAMRLPFTNVDRWEVTEYQRCKE